LNANALLGLPNRVLAGSNSGMVYSSAVDWTPTDIVQLEVRDPSSYNYLLFMPRNRSEESNGKLPLILFLHGIDALDGTVGGPSNLQLVKKEGLPKILDGNNSFPAIVVSPQCPSETEWYYENIDNNRLINRLLDSVIQRYPVDTNRIIITGLSMGGIGSWYFAIHNPTRFAAIVPVASRGDSGWDVCAIKDSVWAFHGDQDATIPLWKAEAIISAFRACGENPRFTVYPNVGHDCWTITYARQDLYDWMFLQRKH
jgi:predicted peptidase